MRWIAYVKNNLNPKSHSKIGNKLPNLPREEGSSMLFFKSKPSEKKKPEQCESRFLTKKSLPVSLIESLGCYLVREEGGKGERIKTLPCL